jgi:hypothetical protein
MRKKSIFMVWNAQVEIRDCSTIVKDAVLLWDVVFVFVAPLLLLTQCFYLLCGRIYEAILLPGKSQVNRVRNGFTYSCGILLLGSSFNSWDFDQRTQYFRSLLRFAAFLGWTHW